MLKTGTVSSSLCLKTVSVCRVSDYGDPLLVNYPVPFVSAMA